MSVVTKTLHTKKKKKPYSKSDSVPWREVFKERLSSVNGLTKEGKSMMKKHLSPVPLKRTCLDAGEVGNPVQVFHMSLKESINSLYISPNIPKFTFCFYH